jgi:hypothetical protein
VIIAAAKLVRLPALDTTCSDSRARVASILQSSEEVVAGQVCGYARAGLGAAVATGGAAVSCGSTGSLAGLYACDGGEGVDNVG